MNKTDAEDTGYRYREFVRYIRTENRFVLSSDLQTWLVKISEWCWNNKRIAINVGELYYRARVNEAFCNIPYEPEDMLAPPRESACEGRANPAGIPYLYAANNEKTAIAEMRPWVGAKVSVATLTSIRNFIALDYSISGEHTDQKKNDEVDYILRAAFSRPVHHLDKLAYAASQYVAEQFKSVGFEAIFYRSNLTKNGKNVVVFDEGCFNVYPPVFVHEVVAVEYTASRKS